MEIVLTALIISLSNIACMLIGFKFSNGKEVNVTNPIVKLREHKTSKEARYEEEKKQMEIETNLHNIDVYDGTELGQKSFVEY